MSTKDEKEKPQPERNENLAGRNLELTETQAMPSDDLKGAPDGVNTQADVGATGGSDAGDTYPNPHQAAPDRQKGSRQSSFKGGQSIRAYHGPRQLGGAEIEPGGNINAGAKK